jgi:hypothetical protein
LKIHPVNHVKGDKNRYCGPSAISIVTGMASGEAARLIRATSGVKQVQGTHDWQMKAALSKCGIVLSSHPVKKQEPKLIRGKTETRPTLTQWYRDSKELRTPGRVFLVSAGHHWQIVSGRRFCCGRTKEIVSITAKGTNRRARVSNVYELIANDRIDIPAIARKPKAVSRVDPARKLLRALEKKLGVVGRLDRSAGYADYSIPPFEGFPDGITTCHYDWSETLDRIEEAIEYPENLDDCGWLSR